MASTNTSHAAILCIPGMGHIIPTLELAKKLVTHKIIPKVTFFLATIKNPSSSKEEKQVLKSAEDSNLFDIIQLPPIDTTAILGNNENLGLKISVILQQSIPLLFHEISTMKQKPNTLLVELFGCSALSIAEKLKMSKFVYMPPSAFTVSLFLQTPKLDKDVEGEYVDLETPISIPGCKTINPSDLFTTMIDRKRQLYSEYLHLCEMLHSADGILLNTFHDLEPKTIEALKNGQITNVPVYPIGPLIRETKEETNCDDDDDDEKKKKKKKSYVVEWLDKQEEDSVVYVSLGSGYTMSYEQIKEMALGLELSGKKFVWSLRPPADKAGSDNYLTAGITTSQPLDALFPDEFYKIQKMGLVVMDWAPQLEILRHSSVGGFVTHCGWNSVLESVSSGVPMVGWPLFADQRMNAAMLAEETGIAIRVKVSNSTDMVEKEEIAKAIRKIMDKDDIEGCAMRKRVKELKIIAESSWSKGGSSISEMASAFVKTYHSDKEGIINN